MEKGEIVARFLKEGYQIDMSAMGYFEATPEKINEFIQKTRAITPQPSIITLSFVKNTLNEEESCIKIIKNFFTTHENKKNSISGYSKAFADIYTKKKQMLMDRVDSAKLLSINKIQKQKEFVIICMVRENDQIEKSAVVEDLTGSTSVYFKNVPEFENLLENDVVALLCDSSPNNITARKIVWPDIPLNREVRKAKRDVYCIFISDFHMDSENFDKEKYEKFVRLVEETTGKGKYVKTYIFILGGISSKTKDVRKLFGDLPKETSKIFLRSSKDARIPEYEDVMIFESPVYLEIEGIGFLLCQNNTMDAMKLVLKRREMIPCAENDHSRTPSKENTIDNPPDIFVSGGSHSPQTTNYKGVTLITTGDLADNPIFWGAELETRETNKLDLS